MESLVKRLEAVTCRLETVVGGGGAPAAAAAGGAPAGGAAAGGADSPAVQAYNAFVADHVKKFVDLCKAIGGDLNEQANFLETGFAEVGKLVQVAAQSKKPAMDKLKPLLAPIQAQITASKEHRDKNRPSKQFNHLSAVSESIGALAWVCIEPAPAPYVNEMLAAGDFYLIKILKEFRGVDQKHVDWVNAFKGTLTELAAYVKANHTTGLTWNPKGGDASAAAPAAPAPAAGGAPPPPGPPPAPFIPPPAPAAPAPAAGGGGDPAALFADINKGNVTSGLRKVTDDMKTKNRTDKSSVVPAAAKKPVAAPAKKSFQGPQGTPKFALEGNKWVVEFQKDNKEIVIKDTEPRHTVYIYGCTNSVIRVEGKVNAISVDNCRKTGVCFDTVVATAEIVNSNSVELQCTGRCLSIAVDKCSGAQLYLSKDSLDCEIVTSKTDTCNVSIPDGDDLVELSVAEQFKTVIKGKKLVTTCVEHV